MKNSSSGQYLHDDDLDDEERMDGASSGLLGKGKEEETDKFEVPCCGWMSVRYYQPVRTECGDKVVDIRCGDSDRQSIRLTASELS